MTEWSRQMTFDEQWRAIKHGDVGSIIAAGIELVIFMLPVGLLAAALYSHW